MMIDDLILNYGKPEMRTTLNIDSELLIAAKELAEREHKTAGQVVSELLRQALHARTKKKPKKQQSGEDNFGFQTIPSSGRVVTNEHINSLRDELGI